MSEPVIISTEYGVLYPNGTIDWNTTAWFGTIDTPEQRKNFQTQYDLRMRDMGAVGAELQFVTRIKVISCTPYTVVDDGPDVTPEPEAPVVDEAPADAPEGEVEHPVDTPPVEEESPLEHDEPVDTDLEAPNTDDERVTADGG